ncbi:MAG: IS701 family transposase [Gemmatimonadales bacterium]|nr:IS701 family transposase [Gemmatimonadales bacterium]
MDWTSEVERVWQRLRPRFARAEMRVRSRRYLHGLLGQATRKNGWQLAEAVGERTPHGMQALLNQAVWDADAVRDDLRAYVVEHLGDPEAVLVIDETGFLKKGPKSVGVQRQYSGTAGRIENCQIGVFLTYASPHGHAFLDRALYLPQAWAADAPRRDEAGVPPEVSFTTKPQLARAVLARAFAAAVPAGWVTGDEVYGNDGGLRRWLESEQRPYVLAVACAHHIWEGGLQVRVDALVPQIPDEAWQRLDIGAGSKGPRLYDWACARLPYWTAAGWRQWLLLRRSRSDPTDVAFYRAFGREETTLAELARVAGTRWTIEGCLEEAKGEVGLADYEVRRWHGWYRHVTLALVAHAVLAVTRASAAKRGAPTTR